MEAGDGQRPVPSSQSSRRMVALAAAAGAALLVAGGRASSTSVELAAAHTQQTQMLYDIPNFVYERTQTHFPEAEESWLNMAAQGKIGDDVKPEKTLNKLNSIISEARTHGLTENYEARVKAKTLAMTENYNEYDVTKGRIKNKFYDAEKAVSGGVTLKQAPTAARAATLKQAKTAQLASLEGSMMAAQFGASQLALKGEDSLREGEAAVEKGAAAVQSGIEGLKTRAEASLAAIRPAVTKQLTGIQGTVEEGLQEASGAIGVSGPAPEVLKVQVPAGLTAGKKFLAQTPEGGSLLVTVPAGVTGGMWVAVKEPAKTAKPIPVLRMSHPGADAAVDDAISAHYAKPDASGTAAVDSSIAEHNEWISAHGSVHSGESTRARTSQLTFLHPHTRPEAWSPSLSAHPGAAAAVAGGIDAHYDMETEALVHAGSG